MNYRRLGRSGLKLSALSFGSWVTYGNQVDVNAARELMAAAWDHGVNFFDNAEVYARGRSEAIMGEALASLVMRQFRAVYQYWRRVQPDLPETPTAAVDIPTTRPRDWALSP
ncbi:MAG: aldo/keto reductase, partial [Burkholderiaceae bacterium]|nr:aldo/keto reductase [Burkholderiaceae bacterium]